MVHPPLVCLQFDSWVSFAFEHLMSAPVAAVFDKSRAMLAALVNNGIRYSPSQAKVSRPLASPASHAAPPQSIHPLLTNR